MSLKGDLKERRQAGAQAFGPALDLHQIVAPSGEAQALQRLKKGDFKERQLKVLHRLIDYELRGGFEGGMNNAKYQKMTEIGDRTALRDLNHLEERGLMIKTGQLRGTRYHLNVPHLISKR